MIKTDKETAKQRIIDKSTLAFSNLGFDKVSIRQIARDAEVDPALIYHYFENKEDLFIEVMREIVNKNRQNTMKNTSKITGSYIVSKFLTIWGDEKGNSPLIGLMRSTGGTPISILLIKEFIEQVISPYVASRIEKPNVSMLVSLIAVELFGLIYVRNILKLEPLTSLSTFTISKIFGSNISNLLKLDFSSIGDITDPLSVEEGDK